MRFIVVSPAVVCQYHRRMNSNPLVVCALPHRTCAISRLAYALEFSARSCPAVDCLEGILAMVKYLLGWMMGVPVIVLVVVYLLFN